MKIRRHYWQKVRDKADALGTDGCSFVGPAFRECCMRHDLEYRSGRTMGSGRWLTREQADRRFLACMQSRSIFGYWSPLAWARYAAVRTFGESSWKGGGKCRRG